jgi:hypothetical protein
MSYRSSPIEAPLARWASRIALFAASLFVAGLLLHRVFSFPTPAALNLFAVALAGSALAVLVALVALVQIWRRGLTGAAAAFVGLVVPLAVFAGPLVYLPAYLKLPRINDVTTSPEEPPKFVALAKHRPADANPADYPGEAVARLQQQAYPELRTLLLDRSAEEAFELAEDTVRRLGWRVVASEPAVSRPAKPGIIEATDTTLIVGFADDVVVRVEGNFQRARVDVRSASRYGRHDFGQNARRVRRFLAELRMRAEATGPGIASRRTLRTTRTGAMVRKAKERSLEKGEGRSARDRAQPNAQRGRAPRETQR